MVSALRRSRSRAGRGKESAVVRGDDGGFGARKGKGRSYASRLRRKRKVHGQISLAAATGSLSRSLRFHDGWGLDAFVKDPLATSLHFHSRTRYFQFSVPLRRYRYSFPEYYFSFGRIYRLRDLAIS